MAKVDHGDTDIIATDLRTAYRCIAALIYIHTMAWKPYRLARLAIHSP
jgi:hypothetical protein